MCENAPFSALVPALGSLHLSIYNISEKGKVCGCYFGISFVGKFEHFFKCLLATWISSFVTCGFSVLCFLLNCENSLFIRDCDTFVCNVLRILLRFFWISTLQICYFYIMYMYICAYVYVYVHCREKLCNDYFLNLFAKCCISSLIHIPRSASSTYGSPLSLVWSLSKIVILVGVRTL